MINRSSNLMTDAAILKQALEKAKAAGFEWHSTDLRHMKSLVQFNRYYAYIFSHDFAKAFWGEHPEDVPGYVPDGEQPDDYLPPWQVHLQQMVLAEDPLQYLERFL